MMNNHNGKLWLISIRARHCHFSLSSIFDKFIHLFLEVFIEFESVSWMLECGGNEEKIKGKVFFTRWDDVQTIFIYFIPQPFSKYTDKSKRSLNLLFHQLMISLLGRNIPSNNFVIQENSGDLGIDYRCLECSGTDLHRFSERLITWARCALFCLGNFRKYGPLFETMQFLYSCWSLQFSWLSWILCSRFDRLSLGQAGAYSSDPSHQHFNTLPQRTQKTEQWEQRESIWPRAIIGPVLSWLLIWLIQRHVWQCAKTLKEIIPQFSNTEATVSVPFAHVPWAIPTTLADCVQCAMSCRISDFSITVLQIEFGRVQDV